MRRVSIPVEIPELILPADKEPATRSGVGSTERKAIVQNALRKQNHPAYIGCSGISTNHSVFDVIEPFLIDLRPNNGVPAGVDDLELPFGDTARLVRIPQDKHDAQNKPHE